MTLPFAAGAADGRGAGVQRHLQGLHRVFPGGPDSARRSPVRKGYNSRPTSQPLLTKQAAVPGGESAPGMQQGKRFRCTCWCTVPGTRLSSRATSAQRPLNIVMSPMQAIAWVTGDRYTGRETKQRGDACVHLW